MPRVVVRGIERAGSLVFRERFGVTLAVAEHRGERAVRPGAAAVQAHRCARRGLGAREPARVVRREILAQLGGSEPHARGGGARLGPARGLEVFDRAPTVVRARGGAPAANALHQEAKRAGAAHAEVGLCRVRAGREPQQRERTVVETVGERERLGDRHVHDPRPERSAARRLAQLETGAPAVVVLLERGNQGEVRAERLARVRRRGGLLIVALGERRHLEPRSILIPDEPAGEQLGGAQGEQGEVARRTRRHRRQDRDTALRGQPRR